MANNSVKTLNDPMPIRLPGLIGGSDKSVDKASYRYKDEKGEYEGTVGMRYNWIRAAGACCFSFYGILWHYI